MASIYFLGAACASTEAQEPTGGEEPSAAAAAASDTPAAASAGQDVMTDVGGEGASDALAGASTELVPAPSGGTSGSGDLDTSAGASGGAMETLESSGAGDSGMSGAGFQAGADNAGTSNTGVNEGAGAAGSDATSTGGQSDAGGGGSEAGATPEAGVAGGSSEAAPEGEYNPAFVEFYGEDCEVGDAADVNNAMLPDPFLRADGTRIANQSDWRCQRAYLKKGVEKYFHGPKPGTPEVVTGSVTNSSVTVHVEHDGTGIDFSAAISNIPAGANGPVPLMISLGPIGGVGAEGDADFGKTIRDEGVAIMNYSHGDLANEVSRNGLFRNLYGNTDASAQVAWAWGVSRIIDVLVAEKAAGRNDIIEPTAVGVTGCSRNGKGAFTIGAFDERIALAIPQESGTGGVAAFRIVATSPAGPSGGVPQTIASIQDEAAGWLRGGYDYRADVNTFAVDMHSMAAMYAPRGLLILDNARIGYLGGIAGHGAALGAVEVYRALGVEKNLGYHSGNPDDPQGHCSFYKTQAPAVQRAVRAHLTKTAEADGQFETQPGATVEKAAWIDWDTPVLLP